MCPVLPALAMTAGKEGQGRQQGRGLQLLQDCRLLTVEGWAGGWAKR